MKILMIDNYDSFTYNLVQYLMELGSKLTVERNDRVDAKKIRKGVRPEAIVISPGPGRPDDAGNCMEIIRSFSGEIPLLGVCLGHQAIGQALGGKITYAPTLMHGKLSRVRHNGDRLFAGVPREFWATRYHSLIVDGGSLPGRFKILAQTDGEIIMAMKYARHPTYGIQFHPESIMTEVGKTILGNFLELAATFNRQSESQGK